MINSVYEVVIIRRGRENDYVNFWNHNIKKTSKGEDLTPDLLSFTIQIKASNQNKAEIIAREKYPDHTIDYRATAKIG